MLKEVWSGGQTGADQAGLRAAVLCSLATGGWAPYEYMTEEGRAADLLKRFGLRESKVYGYQERTRRNAQETHGTVWFGKLDTPGFEATSKVVVWPEKRPFLVNPSLHDFLVWLDVNLIERLNVAGNRESKNIGIGQRVERWLVEAFQKAISGSEEVLQGASRHPFDVDGSRQRSADEGNLRGESSKGGGAARTSGGNQGHADGNRAGDRGDFRRGHEPEVSKRFWPW